MFTTEINNFYQSNGPYFPLMSEDYGVTATNNEISIVNLLCNTKSADDLLEIPCKQSLLNNSESLSLYYSRAAAKAEDDAYKVGNPGFIIQNMPQAVATLMSSPIAFRSSVTYNFRNPTNDNFIVMSYNTVLKSVFWQELSFDNTNLLTNRFLNTTTSFDSTDNIPGVINVFPPSTINGMAFDRVDSYYMLCQTVDGDRILYKFDDAYTTSTLLMDLSIYDLYEYVGVTTNSAAGANHRYIILGLTSGDVLRLLWDGATITSSVTISISQNISFNHLDLYLFDTGTTPGFMFVDADGLYICEDITVSLHVPPQWPVDVPSNPIYTLSSNNVLEYVMLTTQVTEDGITYVYTIDLADFSIIAMIDANSGEPFSIRGFLNYAYIGDGYILTEQSQELVLYQETAGEYTQLQSFNMQTNLAPTFSHADRTMSVFLYNDSNEQTELIDPVLFLSSSTSRDPINQSFLTPSMLESLASGQYQAYLCDTGVLAVTNHGTLIGTSDYNDDRSIPVTIIGQTILPADTFSSDVSSLYFSSNNRYAFKVIGPSKYVLINNFFLSKYMAQWAETHKENGLQGATEAAFQSFCRAKQSTEFSDFGNANDYCVTVYNPYIIDYLFHNLPTDNGHLRDYYLTHGACYPKATPTVLSTVNYENSDCSPDTIWCPNYLTNPSLETSIKADDLTLDCELFIASDNLTDGGIAAVVVIAIGFIVLLAILVWWIS